jgi:Holliday junction resolvase RusA-like endonuclease
MTEHMTAAEYRKGGAHRMILKPLDGEAVERGALWLTMVPPSLNNLFLNVNRKGRIKTAIYKDWLVRAQTGWHVPGKIRVRLTFNRADTRADLDNLQKPVLDLLVQAGRIADDRNVVELHAAFGAVKGTLIELWTAKLSIPAEQFAACAGVRARAA